MALVQIELVRRHCTEVGWWNLSQFGGDMLQSWCRALASDWFGPAAAGAREGEMRSERAGITLESEGRKGMRNGDNEFLQVLVALDAGPEHARGFRVRKESCAAKGDCGWGSLHGLERVALRRSLEIGRAHV